MKKAASKILCVVFVATMILGAAVCSAAESNYPNKPIELVICFGAGGGADVTARNFARFLEREIGQRINCINIPGSGTVEGMMYVYEQPSDGYTIMATGNSFILKQAQNAAPITFTDEFNPLCNMCSDVMLWCVRKDSQFKNFQQVVDYAKANPGKLTVSGIAAGGSDDFAAHFVAETIGADWTYVPYTQIAEAKSAVLGGEVDILQDKIISILPLIAAGDLIPLVAMDDDSPTVVPELAGVPSIYDWAEYPTTIFRGLAVKKDMPQDIQDFLIEACNRVQENPEFIAYLEKEYLNINSVERDVTKIKQSYIDEVQLYVPFFKERGMILP
jgi:tripartite-type tricarboxylate transporter receptor subunit TctC